MLARLTLRIARGVELNAPEYNPACVDCGSRGAIASVLAPDYHVTFDTATKTYLPCAPPVHEFDSAYGGPVWYIP